MVASVETYNVTNVSTSANITITKPTGTAAGDVLIAAIVCTVGATWTDPADWDIIASSSQAVLFRRVADGTEGASFTFTNNQALGNQRGIVFRISGANPTTPIVDPKIKTTGATTNPTSDSVTATNADSLLVVGLNLITSTTTITVPGGMAEEINDATGQRKAVASLTVGAGATGAKTWTLGASTASATYSFAVNPGTQTITPSGVASTADVGTPTVTPGPVTVSPTGIASTADVGTPTVTPGQVTVSPVGVAPTSDVGTPTVVPGTATVEPVGVSSTADVGTPTITLGNVTISPEGVAPTSAVGTPTVSRQPFVTATVYDHETGNPVGAGATVQLFDENGTLLDTTTTDAGGVYLFQLPFGFTDDVFTVVRLMVGPVEYQGVSEVCAVST